MTQRTAGAWKAQQGISQMVNDGTTIFFRDGWGVFSDADTHGDAKADAHLIAAAPGLLETLERLAYEAERRAGVPKHFIAQARAAIAKAEGK